MRNVGKYANRHSKKSDPFLKLFVYCNNLQRLFVFAMYPYLNKQTGWVANTFKIWTLLMFSTATSKQNCTMVSTWRGCCDLACHHEVIQSRDIVNFNHRHS